MRMAGVHASPSSFFKDRALISFFTGEELSQPSKHANKTII